MIQATAKSDTVLAVGQTGAFNPAVAAARPMLTDPRLIEARLDVSGAASIRGLGFR